MNDLQVYRQTLDCLSYTPRQKALMAEKAAAAVKPARHSFRGGFSWGRLAAAAACLVSVLTISAEAAGIPTPLSDILAPVFGGSVAQTEVIDRIGRPIDAGDTDNGITISADAILGDAYNACIVFTIRRDDGTALLPEGVNANQLQWGISSDITMIRMGGTHGTYRILDAVPGDHEIQYLHMISADVPLNQGICKVAFRDFQYWDEESAALVPAIEGTWKFRFQVDYEDTSVTLGGGETFLQEDMEVTLTGIRLSPIAVHVSYEVDSEVQWSNAPSGRLPEEDRRQIERYLENIPILLTKKDGTVIDMSNSGGGIRPENGKTYCTKGELLPEVIPLAELESITVGDLCFGIEDPT